MYLNDERERSGVARLVYAGKQRLVSMPDKFDILDVDLVAR
jgi:hypothetical protein